MPSPTAWADTWAASGRAGWRSRSSNVRSARSDDAGRLDVKPEDIPPGGPHPVSALLRRAVIEADRHIYETATANPELAGMGTTLTTLLFSGGYVHLGHVGDSRAYLYRDGRARQISEDHSWIQEQVRAGLISPEEAAASRFRNIITRSVGFEPSVEPDLAGLAVQAGDCFVLCSDGLSNYLTVEEIGQVLTACFYRDVANMLVDLANERGGDDNVTCLVIYAGQRTGLSRRIGAGRAVRPDRAFRRARG